MDFPAYDSGNLVIDLSSFGVYVIAHFPEAGPNNEFQLISEEELINMSRETLTPGASVIKKCGNLRGVVIAASVFYEELRNNFYDIVKEYKVRPKEGEPAVPQPLVSPSGNSSRLTYQQLEELKAMQNNLQTVQRELVRAVQQQEETPSTTNKAKRSRLPVNEDPSTSSKENDDPNMVVIGRGGSKIPRSVYDTLQWRNHSVATRQLLSIFFSKEVLATRTLTGKQSPTSCARDKEPKKQLDPVIVRDIIEFVSVKYGVNRSLIRTAITTKCSDESKILKKHQLRKEQQENSGTDTQN